MEQLRFLVILMEIILLMVKVIRNGKDKYFQIRHIFLLSKSNKKSFIFIEEIYKIRKFKVMVNLSGLMEDIILETSLIHKCRVKVK